MTDGICPAGVPKCVGNDSRCDLGDMGYCPFGSCACGTSGIWSITKITRITSLLDCNIATNFWNGRPKDFTWSVSTGKNFSSRRRKEHDRQNQNQVLAELKRDFETIFSTLARVPNDRTWLSLCFSCSLRPLLISCRRQPCFGEWRVLWDYINVFGADPEAVAICAH